jgi:hypothetical protein
MSNPQTTESTTPTFGREEMLSALFVQLVMQQSNLAMMLMGKVAHPESGKAIQDLEGARLFIDQLEMLEVKTRGNLSKEEAALLKQHLTNLRLTFVDTVESASPAAADPKEKAQPADTTTPSPEADKNVASSASTAPTEDDEHRKKFSKKY